MSCAMIGVLSRELYKPLGILSHSLPPRSPLHSPPPPPLRTTLRVSHLQWTPTQTPKSARNSSWLSPACPAPCPPCPKRGVSSRFRSTPPPCLPSTLLRAKPRYASPEPPPSSASVFTLSPAAPQSAFEIGHSVQPITDRDTPAQPSLVSLSPTDDEGVWQQFHILGAYRS